jgi:hypothetical protein
MGWFLRLSLWCVQGRMQVQASSRERTQRVGRTTITGATCAGSLLSQVDQGDLAQNRGDSYSLMKILLHSRPAFIVLGCTQMETTTKGNQYVGKVIIAKQKQII